MLSTIKYLFTRFVLVVTALQILNLSVCIGDYNLLEYNYVSNNSLGDINPIDSVIEYFAEIVFNYQNAIPENDSHSNDSNERTTYVLKHTDFNKLFNCYQTAFQPVYITLSSNFSIPLSEDYKFTYYHEINPPPPKFIA